MDKIEEKPKLAFVGNSHIAFWALNIYFPQWECLNYGVPGEGLAYVEAFDVDTSDCRVVIQFGSNDIYQLNDENVDGYVERYVKAVLAVLPEFGLRVFQIPSGLDVLSLSSH